MASMLAEDKEDREIEDCSEGGEDGVSRVNVFPSIVACRSDYAKSDFLEL